MFEPVTMTRSAVAVAAADAGTTFPCASRAGAGDGPCAERLKTMAKEIASRTETLRSNPHPRSWIFFIQVRLCLRRIRKTPDNIQCHCVYNCQNGTAPQSCARSAGSKQSCLSSSSPISFLPEADGTEWRHRSNPTGCCTASRRFRDALITREEARDGRRIEGHRIIPKPGTLLN